MPDKSPNVSPAVAAALISLIVGGAVGYYIHAFATPNPSSSAPVGRRPATAAGGGGAMGGMGGGGGGGFGGGGGGFGAPPTGGAALARLVRNLDTIEEAQGKGLTPDQAKTLLPILNKIKAADKIPADEADKQVAAIEKVLTPAQKEALDSLQPQRGGGGGGGGRGGGGAPGGGAPGGPPAAGGAPGGGGMGGGGGRPDPDRPFASERSKKSLDGLIAHVGK